MKRRMALCAVLCTILATLTLLPGEAWAATGRQRFFIYVTGNFFAQDPTVIGTGVVNKVGIDLVDSRVENPDGSFDIHGRFVFPDGEIAVHNLGQLSIQFNPVRCVGTLTFSGTWDVTGGTGAYVGADGGGTFSGRGTFVNRRAPDGTCTQENAGGILVRNHVGTLTVPGAA